MVQPHCQKRLTLMSIWANTHNVSQSAKQEHLPAIHGESVQTSRSVAVCDGKSSYHLPRKIKATRRQPSISFSEYPGPEIFSSPAQQMEARQNSQRWSLVLRHTTLNGGTLLPASGSPGRPTPRQHLISSTAACIGCSEKTDNQLFAPAIRFHICTKART